MVVSFSQRFSSPTVTAARLGQPDASGAASHAGSPVQTRSAASPGPHTAAMQAPAREQGRHLGEPTPPYGYRVSDIRCRTASQPSGRSVRAPPTPSGSRPAEIARMLNEMGVPCPSAVDREHNRHHPGGRWTCATSHFLNSRVKRGLAAADPSRSAARAFEWVHGDRRPAVARSALSVQVFGHWPYQPPGSSLPPLGFISRRAWPMLTT